MAEVDYSGALNRISSQVAAVGAAVGALAVDTDHLRNEVQVVDAKVVAVYNDLAVLQNQFNLWVKEQRNANNLQRSLTEVIRVRQELEQKFGKHAEARKRLHGILDTADTGLLREFTIASCSEQIMLDTPKYWLSPCLVALAAWISNDKDLTDRAIKVALDRDVEKATLLFALVSRRTVPAGTANSEAAVRAARQAACFNWLDSYFKCQNPLKMKESVIVLIDSWANDVFGEDSGNICSQTFDSWMETVRESAPNFKEEQIAHWYAYYTYYNEGIAAQVPALSKVTPEFQRIEEYVQRLQAAPKIQHHFDQILSAKINKEDLINRLDEQLEALISEFDPEEEGLRQEEIHHQLVKKFEGDAEKVAREEQKRAKKKTAERVSLAQRLEDVLRSKDSKYAAARKTALKEKFLGQYVKDAYADYITDKKDAFPNEITLRDNSGWSAKTVDGNNESEVTGSYTSHMNNLREKELAGVNTSKAKGMFIGAGVAGVLGIIMFIAKVAAVGVIGIIAAAVLAVLGYKANKTAKFQKDQINQKYDAAIANGKNLLSAALSDWRKILEFVTNFQLNPENEVLDLTEKETVVAAEYSEPTPVADVAADELSLDALAADESIDADDEELVALEGEENYSLNQSAEFLRQFATQFSTAFVLEVPQVNFAEKKAMQDRK